MNAKATKIQQEHLAVTKIMLTFANRIRKIIIMTTVELKTSIAAELEQMNVEMLESVSRYVRRLRRRSRSVAPQLTARQHKREAAMLFVKTLSVQGGNPVPVDERGIDALVNEKYAQ